MWTNYRRPPSCMSACPLFKVADAGRWFTNVRSHFGVLNLEKAENSTQKTVYMSVRCEELSWHSWRTEIHKRQIPFWCTQSRKNAFESTIWCTQSSKNAFWSTKTKQWWTTSQITEKSTPFGVLNLEKTRLSPTFGVLNFKRRHLSPRGVQWGVQRGAQRGIQRVIQRWYSAWHHQHHPNPQQTMLL